MKELRERMPLWQGLLWVLVGGICMQFAGALATGIGAAIVGAEAVSSPGVMVASMLASGLGLLLVTLLAPLVSGVRMSRALGFAPARPSVYLAAAFGTVALGPLADLLMTGMAYHFPDATLGIVPMLHDLVAGQPVVLIWPVFALLPGVAEELLFRGVLQRSVVSARAGMLISAVGFASFHVDPHHVVGVLPLGLFLAFVAARASTQVSIFAHVVNNTVAIIAVHSGSFDVGYGTDRPMPWEWIPASLVVVVACFAVVVRGTRSTATGA